MADTSFLRKPVVVYVALSLQREMFEATMPITSPLRVVLLTAILTRTVPLLSRQRSIELASLVPPRITPIVIRRTFL